MRAFHLLITFVGALGWGFMIGFYTPSEASQDICHAFTEQPKFTEKRDDQLCCAFENPHPYSNNKIFKLCRKL